MKLMGVVTVLALVYIYMQMQIISLGYKHRLQQEHINKIREQNGQIAYTISTLKSASHLGHVMLREGSDMHFVDSGNVFEVAVRRPSFNDSHIQRTARVSQGSAPFSGLISLVAQAEASTGK